MIVKLPNAKIVTFESEQTIHKDKILWGLIWYIPIFEDVSQNKKLSEIKPPLQRTGIQTWPYKNTFSLIMK